MLELGMDSLMAVELRNRLRSGLAIREVLPATLVFDYPTAGALAGYLIGVLFPTTTHEEPENRPPDATHYQRRGRRCSTASSRCPMKKSTASWRSSCNNRRSNERVFGADLEALAQAARRCWRSNCKPRLTSSSAPRASQSRSSEWAVGFPGGADDPESFWQLLRSGVDAVVDIPGDRWDRDAYYDADPSVLGKMSTRRGGFLDRVDEFDPQFFGILPGEARTMDPQQRLVLEVAWEALEDAGIAADGLVGKPHRGLHRHRRAGLCPARDQPGTTRPCTATLPPESRWRLPRGGCRMSWALNGPCMSLDTSCSSSLVAISLGLRQSAGGSMLTMALPAGST